MKQQMVDEAQDKDLGSKMFLLPLPNYISLPLPCYFLSHLCFSSSLGMNAHFKVNWCWTLMQLKMFWIQDLKNKPHSGKV